MSPEGKDTYDTEKLLFSAYLIIYELNDTLDIPQPLKQLNSIFKRFSVSSSVCTSETRFKANTVPRSVATRYTLPEPPRPMKPILA